MSLLKFGKISSREGRGPDNERLGYVQCLRETFSSSIGDELSTSKEVVAMLDWAGSEIGIFPSEEDARAAVLEAVRVGKPHISSIDWSLCASYVRGLNGNCVAYIGRTTEGCYLYSDINNIGEIIFPDEEQARTRITEEYASYINKK